MQYILYNQAAITIMKVTTILCALIDIQHLVDMTGVAAFAFHSRSFGRRILVQGEIDFLCVEIRDLLWKQAMCLVAQHTKGVFAGRHRIWILATSTHRDTAGTCDLVLYITDDA